MKSKWCCSLQAQLRITSQLTLTGLALIALSSLGAIPAFAGSDAPSWMHAVVGTPLPAYDDKTDAILLYGENNVTVLSTEKIRIQVRRVYKIIRPGGRQLGYVGVNFNPNLKITSLHGWCIPAQGKDYEVRDKDAVEISLPSIDGSELISDVREKFVRIPAADPGNIIGYEYEVEVRPLVLQHVWRFQDTQPVREEHYSLQLPAGWEYKATWLNYPEVKPSQNGTNQWQWTVQEVKSVRQEEEMPPIVGVAGEMILSFLPPGGRASNGFSGWQEMGGWYTNLTIGRRDASPEIKQQVAILTASSQTPLAKMRALANFAQHDVRYVAISLGIGGVQPHAASDVFAHRYGDCKDKATLMISMLHEIGIDSYYVVINSERGSVSPETPAHVAAFDHVVVAIKLPDGLKDPALVGVIDHPRSGKLLFFDPTNEFIPFGQLGGYLQSNYGLLVTPAGGELVLLPKQPSAMNSIARVGKLTLDVNGNLKGEVSESRMGNRASSQRWALRNVSKDADRIKPIEGLLSGSLANFTITKATVANLHQMDQPFGFDYQFEAAQYAKTAGDLLLVRPRVLGTRSSGLLETKEPRKFAIEFEGPERDTDTFEITLPVGFEVDDLPPPVDAEYSFASYHSKTEAHGNVISYTRSFELKELSVPVTQAEELKKFYRIIATDERNTAVLKPIAK
jgi:hypothetical protein